MKKSVLSIVAIAFAAVSVFTSCDKNDDGYGQSAKTQETVQSTQPTTHNLALEACVSAGQVKYANLTIVLSVDGRDMTVDLSQMKEISSGVFTADAAHTSKAFGDPDVKTYSFDLSSIAGKKFEVKSVTSTPKTVDASEFKGQKCAFLHVVGFNQSGKSCSTPMTVVNMFTLDSAKVVKDACQSISMQACGEYVSF